MILDLLLLPVFHAPSYCSFTSNLTMFSLIIDYWINSGIYNAFIMIIINLIIDKSRLCYKITLKYWQKYCILNYTRIKPISRPPQKKIRIFYAPWFFSGQNKKKVRKLREQIRYFDSVYLTKFILVVLFWMA
jgi:hypothetical protein